MDYKKGDIVYRELPDTVVGGKWTYKVDGPLIVMGQIEKYLMVRKKGCMPFVLAVRDALKKPDDGL